MGVIPLETTQDYQGNGPHENVEHIELNGPHEAAIRNEDIRPRCLNLADIENGLFDVAFTDNFCQNDDDLGCLRWLLFRLSVSVDLYKSANFVISTADDTERDSLEECVGAAILSRDGTGETDGTGIWGTQRSCWCQGGWSGYQRNRVVASGGVDSASVLIPIFVPLSQCPSVPLMKYLFPEEVRDLTVFSPE
ncbi:hypothetical protein ACH5RR_003767 [Cinchona calisaya]|uniref:Uncharacterized protein n=1 Tax=Cinchona calisaya TaxID=153742 RepID=A0ABD3AVU3_9GENT